MNKKVLIAVVTVVMMSCSETTKSKIEKEGSIEADSTISVVDTISIENPIMLEQPSIQLIRKHELTEKDLYMDYDGGSQLADFFIIELIDKDMFQKNKSLSVNHILSDTLSFTKNKGILKLPHSTGEINFVDNLTGEENFKEYTYIGQIKDLNVYLVSGIYWEDWNYFFVDKNTGKTVQTFASLPYLSANQKYIIGIDVDAMEGTTYIDLYEVSGRRQIDPLLGIYAKKWVPIDTFEKMYWGNDNYLYIPVVHNSDFWAAEGNYAGLDQYIRLKPAA